MQRLQLAQLLRARPRRAEAARRGHPERESRGMVGGNGTELDMEEVPAHREPRLPHREVQGLRSRDGDEFICAWGGVVAWASSEAACAAGCGGSGCGDTAAG